MTHQVAAGAGTISKLIAKNYKLLYLTLEKFIGLWPNKS